MVENAASLDVIMPMYNLLEHSENYSVISASLWNYYKDEVNNDDENKNDNINVSGIKDGVYVISLDNKKGKKHIGFYYWLTEIQLYSLILLELNIFLKKYETKSKINQLLTIYLKYKMMTLLFVDFIILLS